MPNILPFRPHRSFIRPRWPFAINARSWEARGLIFWAPVVPSGLGDLVEGGRGTFTATFTGYANMPLFGPSLRFGVSSTGQRLNVRNRRPYNYGPTANGGGPFTLSCWAVKEQAPASSQWLFGTGSAAASTSILVDSSQRFNFIGPFAGTQQLVVSTDTVTVGTLYHFAATTDGSGTSTNVHLYINGIECTYTTQQNGVTGTGLTGDIIIGNLSTAASTLPWRGAITDCRIYNYQMSGPQIDDLRIGAPYWDLYDTRRAVIFDVAAASTFLPRLAVLGAG